MRTRRRLPGLLAFGVAGVMALSGVAGTSAAMAEEGPAEQCSGANIEGQGSSLQAAAMELWAKEFNKSEFPGACNGTQGSKAKPTAKYNPSGSGEGRKVWGAEKELKSPLDGSKENPAESGDAFVASDEPLTAKQMENIDEAAGAGEKGKGQTLVIPVEQAAVAVIVNPPAECLITKVTNKNLQEIWNLEITEWSGITGGKAEGAGVTEDKSGACKSAITRVVRQDVSGTTFVFKTYLSEILKTATCSGKTWAEYALPAENLNWPEGTGCKAGKVVHAKNKGGKGEVEEVVATSGSIGYANLADARKGYTDEEGNHYHWLGVQNESEEDFYPYPGTTTGEPSLTVGESNCAKTHYTNVPTEVLTDDNWSEVNGAHPKGNANYPICTLTYDIALYDYYTGHFYTGTTGTKAAEEEANKIGTTAYNFINYAVAPEGGQLELAKHDYREVEEAVGTYAQQAAQLVAGGTLLLVLYLGASVINWGLILILLADPNPADIFIENIGPLLYEFSPFLVILPLTGGVNFNVEPVNECTGMLEPGTACLLEINRLENINGLGWLVDMLGFVLHIEFD